MCVCVFHVCVCVCFICARVFCARENKEKVELLLWRGARGETKRRINYLYYYSHCPLKGCEENFSNHHTGKIPWWSSSVVSEIKTEREREREREREKRNEQLSWKVLFLVSQQWRSNRPPCKRPANAARWDAEPQQSSWAGQPREQIRPGERERECVCVCVWERERERERERFINNELLRMQRTNVKSVLWSYQSNFLLSLCTFCFSVKVTLATFTATWVWRGRPSSGFFREAKNTSPNMPSPMTRFLLSSDRENCQTCRALGFGKRKTSFFFKKKWILES